MRPSFPRATQGSTAWAAVDQKHNGWEAVTPRSVVPVLLLVLVSLAASRADAAPLSADMIVSVPDQVLALVDRGKLIAQLLNFDLEVRNRRFRCQLSHAAWHIIRFSKNRRPIASGRSHQKSHSDR